MTRYELLDRIGVGGMAEIFRGRAVAGGGFEKPVAIKRILPHLSKDKRFVDLLIVEANTLSQLRHRNIVQIFDVGLGTDGQYFLVMEFVQGSDLGALYAGLAARGKRLPAQLSLHIAAEVCDALDFAHRATAADGTALKLVHRDVSPSNILLSRMGEVKLTDFGIAKRMEEVTGHGSVRGKFAYISPEQAHNTSVDARSDVFSLGIILFELVTGRPLFSSLPDFVALQSVREVKVPRPRDFDPTMPLELEQILLKALARAPDERYDSAATFGAALREYRYSSLTSAGDPAKELARILDALVSQPPEHDFAPEPTVVRIETAAGFTGLDLAARITGSGELDMFDQEETRALSGEQLRDIMTDDAMRSRPHAAVASRPDSVPPLEHILDDAPSGSIDLADEPTTMMPPRSVPAVAPSPERAATPTIRELFHRGAMVAQPPQADLQTDAIRHEDDSRLRVIALGIVAALVGVAAFAIAVTLLEGEPASRQPAVADPSAAPQVELPPGEITTGDEARAAMNDAGPAKDEPKAKPARKRKRPGNDHRKKRRRGKTNRR